MLRKIEREIPLFEKLGLFVEAPRKKRKPEVINVTVPRSDYNDSIPAEEEIDIDLDDIEIDDAEDYGDYVNPDEIDIDDEDIDALDITDEELADLPPEEAESQDNGDIEIEEPEVSDVPAEEVPVENPETNDAPPQEDQQAEPVADVQNQEEPAGDTEVIDVDSGIDTDYTTEVEPTADGSGEETADPNTVQQPKENFTKDDMRKFELFKNFTALYESILYFIEKLDSFVTDDVIFSKTTYKVKKIFSELSELMKDYMLLKFQSDSFLQNSFFYEKIKANSLLAIELLNINKIKFEDNKQ